MNRIKGKTRKKGKTKENRGRGRQEGRVRRSLSSQGVTQNGSPDGAAHESTATWGGKEGGQAGIHLPVPLLSDATGKVKDECLVVTLPDTKLKRAD